MGSKHPHSRNGRSTQGAKQHVGLPDLIGELRFVLLVRGGFVEQQLALGEPADAQETIERGSGNFEFGEEKEEEKEGRPDPRDFCQSMNRLQCENYSG